MVSVKLYMGKTSGTIVSTAQTQFLIINERISVEINISFTNCISTHINRE